MSGRTFKITFSIMAVVLAALIFLNIMEDNRKTWDVCYDMANAKISWQQTFYPGPWNLDN